MRGHAHVAMQLSRIVKLVSSWGQHAQGRLLMHTASRGMEGRELWKVWHAGTIPRRKLACTEPTSQHRQNSWETPINDCMKGGWEYLRIVLLRLHALTLKDEELREAVRVAVGQEAHDAHALIQVQHLECAAHRLALLLQPRVACHLQRRRLQVNL